ncbi:hypothetical protein [Arcobacter sp. FWKO B]|uniref:hypothetical protein n=1 Tax=Arcobacter sp. FWKO B TaxID=2593672 RepID=UPI0018A62647|nr:hypothetical protein [Arcobacter sp. FWKO B]QOG12438.1 hypothetical protein FWKOB_06870 [Arcobacter sp. FWKO B]
MNKIFLFYLFKIISLFKFLFIGLLLCTLLILWNEIMWSYDLVNENRGYFHLFVSIFVGTIVFPILLLTNIIKILKRIKQKRPHDFLFFAFYFLFFAFYFINLYIMYISLIYSLFGLALGIIGLMVSIKRYFFFKRYLFIILTAISDVFLKYALSNDLLAVFTTSNKQFYELKLYLIPLTFALIQLSIEAYYFYQKEKPKWERYERMQKYKESKNQ